MHLLFQTCDEVSVMAARGCKYPADSFCYVCGEFFARGLKNTTWTVAPVQRKPIMPTSGCQLVTKINAGHHMSSVTTAAVLSKVGLEERRGQCVSLYPVSGVSLQIISRTVIFVWLTQQNEERGRMRLPLYTLTFRHLLHLFPITQWTYPCHSLH